jgi:hypothetical protein
MQRGTYSKTYESYMIMGPFFMGTLGTKNSLLRNCTQIPHVSVDQGEYRKRNFPEIK